MKRRYHFENITPLKRKMMMFKDCSCKYWKENIGKISGPMIFKAIHGMGGYEGKLFLYCPWCGKKLVKSRKEQKDD